MGCRGVHTHRCRRTAGRVAALRVGRRGVLRLRMGCRWGGVHGPPVPYRWGMHLPRRGWWGRTAYYTRGASCHGSVVIVVREEFQPKTPCRFTSLFRGVEVAPVVMPAVMGCECSVECAPSVGHGGLLEVSPVASGRRLGRRDSRGVVAWVAGRRRRWACRTSVSLRLSWWAEGSRTPHPARMSGVPNHPCSPVLLSAQASLYRSVAGAVYRPIRPVQDAHRRPSPVTRAGGELGGLRPTGGVDPAGQQ